LKAWRENKIKIGNKSLGEDIMKDQVLAEAKRLYDLGFAIHWLHPKSKRPIESRWTTGPRKKWDYLKETYQRGLNVGVRLGEPSQVNGKFLAVIDVDVKSKDAKHGQEINEGLGRLTNVSTLPEVTSGRGNGSRHYYVLTDKPLKPFKALQSKEVVKVPMPSVKPSKKEFERLTPQEIADGLRLRPAWEIGVMGDGQQVVLPPSIHPDSGKHYAWRKPFRRVVDAVVKDIAPLTKPETEEGDGGKVHQERSAEVNQDFIEEKVDLAWLPVSDKIKRMIQTGEGVTDRSASLLPVSHALFQAGLTRNEVLTVLTDPNTYLGKCAYDHAQTNSRKRAAAWVYRYTLKKVLEENSAEKLFREPIAETRELSFDELSNSEEGEKEIRKWTDDLDITKDDKYKTNLKNTVMILENVAHDFIKRDLFAIRDTYTHDTPWDGIGGRAVDDDELPKIKLWLSHHFGIEPSNGTIGDALTVLATQNAYDPVIDWLDGLPAWDKKPRLDTWLRKHFHAKGNEEYLAQVFRKWMVAMVARILEPGIKFDWLPIFEGAQGVGKSSFGRLLVGDKYFLDWLPDLSNKDAALALQGVWAVEMGELASFRKNELEIVKAFMTRTIDKVRPPYGRRTVEVPRRCVFFGTTNNATYLKDESGNRRFKPVEVGRLDFNVLKREREQLFAEARWLWDTKKETSETFELTGEAVKFEANIHQEKMVQTDSHLMAESIQIFAEKELKKPQDERFNFGRFLLQELFENSGAFSGGSGPLKNWRRDPRNTQFAAKAVKMLGGGYTKIRGLKYYELRKLAQDLAPAPPPDPTPEPHQNDLDFY